VENKWTSYNFRLFAIFVLKIVRVGGNLTKVVTIPILLDFFVKKMLVETIIPAFLL